MSEQNAIMIKQIEHGRDRATRDMDVKMHYVVNPGTNDKGCRTHTRISPLFHKIGDTEAEFARLLPQYPDAYIVDGTAFFHPLRDGDAQKREELLVRMV